MSILFVRFDTVVIAVKRSFGGRRTYLPSQRMSIEFIYRRECVDNAAACVVLLRRCTYQVYKS